MGDIISFKANNVNSKFKIRQSKLHDVLVAFTQAQLHEHFNELYFPGNNNYAIALKSLTQLTTAELFNELIKIYSSSDALVDQIVDKEGNSVDMQAFLNDTLDLFDWLTDENAVEFSEYMLTIPQLCVGEFNKSKTEIEFRQYKFKRFNKIPYLIDIYVNGKNLASITCDSLQKLANITFEDFLN